MNWKGIGITAVVMAMIAEVVHTVESILTMGFYTDPAYFQLWSKLMMPAAGPPPLSFFIYSIVFALIGWFFFAYAYAVLGGALKAKGCMKGLKFGALVFLVAGLSCTLMLYLLINLPMALLASWTVSSLLLYLIGGVVAERFIR
ncbi:MAG: hypothetical protein PHS02_03200 [Candidatus ainarchaeum sp.]|nr:hypothetical protein [Candidatus ainarchaeum sp.]